MQACFRTWWLLRCVCACFGFNRLCKVACISEVPFRGKREAGLGVHACVYVRVCKCVCVCLRSCWVGGWGDLVC